jgi:hypothetical protein
MPGKLPRMRTSTDSPWTGGKPFAEQVAFISGESFIWGEKLIFSFIKNQDQLFLK